MKQEVKELKTPWTWSWEGQSPFQGLGSAVGSGHAGPHMAQGFGIYYKCSYFGGWFVEELDAPSQCASPSAAQAGSSNMGLQDSGTEVPEAGGQLNSPKYSQDWWKIHWLLGSVVRKKKNLKNCIFHTMEINSRLCQYMWWVGPDSRVFPAFSTCHYLSFIL